MHRRPPNHNWVLLAILALFTSVLACGHAPAPYPSDPTKETINLGAAPASGPASSATTPANEADLPIPIRADDPTRGNRNAFVTLVVFSDFQCPFCAKLAETLEQLSVRYGPDSLRIVFKHQPLPFHDKATLTAEIAANVMQLGGSTAFWAFHNIAFARQSNLSEQEAIAWAVEVGINEKALRANLAQHRGQSKVAEDAGIAKSVGVFGTPCSFVNGALVSGAQPLSNFVEVIDAELEKAKSLATRGVNRDAVYGRMLTTNLEAQEAKNAAAKKAGRDDDDEPEDTATYNVVLGAAPMRGPATALVTIVEFSDFQCPFCSRVGPTLDRIRKEYGDKVRLVWKDSPLPFHTRALPAANFARSARAQKGVPGFWAAHDRLFATQAHMEDADLEQLAKSLGLNPGLTMSAVRTNAFKAQIDADVNQGKAFKVTGTPTFFINGRTFTGSQPFEKFKVLIDQELARAEALLKTGVARAALYDALLKGSVAPAPASAPTVPPPGGPAIARGVQGVAPSTLQTIDLKVGTGAVAKSGDEVRVHYVGTLANGTEFDSSRAVGRTPFVFTLGKGHVIKGWDQGVLGMRVGGRRKLTVPPSFAYGDGGRPPVIPAGSTLVFDIELLEVK